MISIIICSRDTKVFKLVSESIQETIGVEYEIIGIDNSNGKYSICQAYNIGAERSNFDFLCFMHEDLTFKTNEWGKIVLEYFNDVSIGLIGVAGSKFKSKSNSPWWGVIGLFPEYHNLRYIQSYESKAKSEYCSLNPNNEVIADVVTLDGFWLFTRKSIWRNNKFDEHILKGFHFYDLDFSLQVKQKFRVCVIYDLLIEHKSAGSVNKSWAENSIVFHEKWKDYLPISTITISPKELHKYELLIALDFLQKLKDLGFNKAVIFKFYIQYLKICSFRDYLWILKNSITNSIKTLW